MPGFSTTAEDALLRKMLKDTAFSWEPVEMGVHTADPGNTGANEAANSGGSTYARLAIPGADWSDPSVVSSALGSECANLNDLIILNMPAGTFTHASLWSTGGDFIMSAALTVPMTLTLGQAFALRAGAFKVNMK